MNKYFDSDSTLKRRDHAVMRIACNAFLYGCPVVIYYAQETDSGVRFGDWREVRSCGMWLRRWQQPAFKQQPHLLKCS